MVKTGLLCVPPTLIMRLAHTRRHGKYIEDLKINSSSNFLNIIALADVPEGRNHTYYFCRVYNCKLLEKEIHDQIVIPVIAYHQTVKLIEKYKA